MTFRSSASLAGGSAATANVPVPAGAAVGDIAVVAIYKESTSAITPPTGFFSKTVLNTSATSRGSIYVYYKRLTAADSGTWNFSWSGSTFRGAAAGLWSGRITSGDPFSGAPGTAQSTTTVTTLNVSVTPAVDGCDAVGFWSNFNGGASWTPPTNYTERVDIPVITMDTRDGVAATSTGSISATSTISDFSKAFLGALAPDAAASVTGSGAATAAAATASGSGDVSLTGSGSVTAPVATGAGSGSVGSASATGSGAATAPAAIASGSATLNLTGTGAGTSSAATASGAGTLKLTGSGAVTAPPATGSSTGTLTLTGSAAVIAAASTAIGSGAIGNVVSGAATVISAAATATGAGTVRMTGAATATAPAGTATGTASVRLTGAATGTAAPATGTGSGTLRATATAATTAPAAQATGTGTVTDPGEELPPGSADITSTTRVAHLRTARAEADITSTNARAELT